MLNLLYRTPSRTFGIHEPESVIHGAIQSCLAPAAAEIFYSSLFNNVCRAGHPQVF